MLDSDKGPTGKLLEENRLFQLKLNKIRDHPKTDLNRELREIRSLTLLHTFLSPQFVCIPGIYFLQCQAWLTRNIKWREGRRPSHISLSKSLSWPEVLCWF